MWCLMWDGECVWSCEGGGMVSVCGAVREVG